MDRYRIAKSRSLSLDLCFFALPATGGSAQNNIDTQYLDYLPSLGMHPTLGELVQLRAALRRSITRSGLDQLSSNNLLHAVRTPYDAGESIPQAYATQIGNFPSSLRSITRLAL